MNQNRKVVVFTLWATFLFLLFSIYVSYSRCTYLSLDKISIVSDVLENEAVEQAPDSLALAELPTDRMTGADSAAFGTDSLTVPADTIAVADSPPVTVKPNAAKKKADSLPDGQGQKVFSSYLVATGITHFDKDTSRPALPEVMQKLVALKRGRRDKVRIAWFGDSMIEGDLLTKTFRKRLQQYFGGYGVGFVPATSVTSAYRNTIQHKWKGNWKEENFKTDHPTQPLYLSGHTFFTQNGELNLTDKTVPDTAQLLEKSLICGPSAMPLDVRVNGQTRRYTAARKINRLLLDSGRSHKVEIELLNNPLPVYGVSLEPPRGVVVDNFSFRGITGLELGKLDTSLLHVLETENNYDLVVLEYGANLMFRPDEKDYSWYGRHIIGVVSRLQQAMPHTEFLIVSTADRAFLYDHSWKTATGINNLVKTQAELAYRNNTAFYNLFKHMGGAGTIVRWADATPPLANKDYIHPNFKGADLLGDMLYEAFMRDYHKVDRGLN